MAELKPCPFCGQSVRMIYNSLDDAHKFYHKGFNDEDCCIIEPIMVKAKSLADAAQKWNRRAEDGK